MLVRYDAHPGDTDRWIIKGTHGDPGTGSRYEIFQTSGDQVRFAIDNGPDNIKSSLRPEGTNAAIITGDWVHVVAIRDAENDLLSLYADGVLLGTLADGSGDISSGEDMWIGESTDETATAMAGDMKDIRIYDVALTEDDIAAIYAVSPIAYWPLDEGAGTVAADVVGGNDGTLLGTAAWITDGAMGSAVRFDGIEGNRIEVPNSETIDFGDVDFSVSICIRYPEGVDPAGLSNKWFMKGTSSSPGTGSRYELFLDDGGDVRFTIDNGPTNTKSRAQINDPSLVVTGDWVNLVGVRDAANDLLSLYIDGALVATQVDSSGDISSGEPLVIGEHAPGGSTMLGDIDDIRIYDVVLTEDDIAAMN
jgi:hypothetical protein